MHLVLILLSRTLLYFLKINYLRQTGVYRTYKFSNFLRYRLRFYVVWIRSVLPVRLSLWHLSNKCNLLLPRKRLVEVNQCLSNSLRSKLRGIPLVSLSHSLAFFSELINNNLKSLLRAKLQLLSIIFKKFFLRRGGRL